MNHKLGFDRLLNLFLPLLERKGLSSQPRRIKNKALSHTRPPVLRFAASPAVLLASAALLSAAPTPQPQPEPGFQSIFDGQDLAGWGGITSLWSVKDGAITGQTTAENPARKNTFLVWTNGMVGDFELRCLFKLTPNNPQGFANSGVQFRSQVVEPDYWVVHGYQADMEAGPIYTGTLYEEGSPRGTMARRGEKVVWNKDCQKEVVGTFGSAEQLASVIAPGQWNSYDIIAQSNHLQEFINGRQMIDVVDDCAERRAMSGVLALQLHAGPPMTVQFKDLRLKQLQAQGAAEALKALQGTWQMVSSENAGDPVPADQIANLVISIQNNRFELSGRDGTVRGTFTLDPSKQPGEIQIQPQGSDDAGMMMKGIYELTNDVLRVCYSTPGGDRPHSFSTTNSDRTLIECKRKPE